MPPHNALHSLVFVHPSEHRVISDDIETVLVDNVKHGSCFATEPLERMRDRIVLIITTKQLATVLALIELDGIAKRVMLCPPDLLPHLLDIVTESGVDFVVSDDTMLSSARRNANPSAYERLAVLGVPLFKANSKIVSHGHPDHVRDIETEWVLFTSGTTGRPKMVVHTLASLAGPMQDGTAPPSTAVWSTFYDIRRYGGLQILLRALIGGGSMILSVANEPVNDFLMRLGDGRVTHLSGTPSHWRRALMTGHMASIDPAYVRMSGEIADQNILTLLKTTFPRANIAHAFASTEAGVAFDVAMGLAGFPVAFLTDPGHVGVELRVQNDTLWIRSSRTSSGYIGQDLPQDDGFIDTGDLVELRDDRYYFIGRKEGVINVGGQKVFPEEVEAVIMRHPYVRIARVLARKNPVTGSIVSADVVLQAPVAADQFADIRSILISYCRGLLDRHKVPITWQQVELIPMTAAGKIQRA